MKSNKVNFKDRLNTLLGKRLEKKEDGTICFDALLGKSATFLDLVLVAQIKKASGGDTSSASFLRDTSGNKLKDKVDTEGTRDTPDPFDLL